MERLARVLIPLNFGWQCIPKQRGGTLVCFGLVDAFRNLGGSGELREVPAAAECFDQLDRGGHGLGAKRGESLLVGKESSLRDEDVEISIDAGKVARFCQFEIALGRLFGFYLLLDLFGENADGGHGVFDLLEGGKDGLTIASNVGVVERDELLNGGAPEASVKDGLRERGTDGPETAGPGEEILDSPTFE